MDTPTSSDKVIIIAHSMGGLVSRYYIQSNHYRNDIEALLMVGTPNNGAAMPYPILEGGESVKDKDYEITLDDFYGGRVKKLYNQLAKNPVKNATANDYFDFAYNQQGVPGLTALIPQYKDFLYYGNQTENPLINHSKIKSEIAWLNSGESYKESYQQLTDNYKDKVKTAIFYGIDFDTITGFRATENNNKAPRYPDGQIETYKQAKKEYARPIITKGDETVPRASASTGYRITYVPMDYGGKYPHARMTNHMIDLTIGDNKIFSKNGVNFDSETIKETKKEALKNDTFSSKEVESYTDISKKSDTYLNVSIRTKNSFYLTNDLDQTIGIDDNGNIINNIPQGEIYQYGDEYVILLKNPTLSSYKIMTSNSDNQLEFISVEIAYISDAEIIEAEFNLVSENRKEFIFSLEADNILIESAIETLVSFQEKGNVSIEWESISNAISYNVYREDENNEVVFIKNVTDNFYDTNIPWSLNGDVIIFVEAVFENHFGAVSNFVLNKDMASADLDAETYTTEIGVPIQFHDLSFGKNTSWSWDFGDGNVSNEQNPIHIYQQNGMYDVSLTIPI